MSIIEFALVATPAAAGKVPKLACSKRLQPRAPSDLVISPSLVHLLLHEKTREKLISHLMENPEDFGRFVDLLVPCGSHYLNGISMLARATQGYDHLSEMIRQAYERHIHVVYYDAVKTQVIKSNGKNTVVVTDEGCWKIFLANCARRPELAFVIDVARDMTSPFGNKPFVPPRAPLSAIVAASSAPVPVGMC